MESSASFSIRFCHWALVRIPTLLARLALAEVKSDADTLAVIEFLQPSVIPFGILPAQGFCIGFGLGPVRCETPGGKMPPHSARRSGTTLNQKAT